MKTVLIIGVDQFGSHIAKRMEELRCEVMAVDENEERINNILPYVTNARIGDSTNEEFLRSLGVGNYDVCNRCHRRPVSVLSANNVFAQGAGGKESHIPCDK
jgi:K+ transport systems, NAD-binding component